MYRKRGRWAEALTLFQRFLRDQPSSPLTAEAESYIVEAKARLQLELLDADQKTAEQLAQANAKLAEHLAEIREENRRISEQNQQLKPKPLYRRPWLWVVVGGAAAAGIALGVGLGVGLQPKTPETDLGNRTLTFF